MIVQQTNRNSNINDITGTYNDFKSRINEIWQKYSDKTAIVCIEEGIPPLRFSDLFLIANRVNDLLSDAGLRPSDRVAVISPHSPYMIVLNLVLAYAGFTAVLIDSSLPAEERNRFLEFSDVCAIFTTSEIYHTLDKSHIQNIPAYRMMNDFTYILFPDCVDKLSKKSSKHSDENIIAILFSSGTTGTMKGILITYRSILYAHRYILSYTNLKCNAKFFNVLPSNHIAGYSSALSCALTGTEMGFVSEINAPNLLKGFLTYNPTNFIMIPKVYEVIMQKIQDAISKKPLFVRWYADFAMTLCGNIRRATGLKLRFITKPIWKAALGKNMKICGCGTAPCPEEVKNFYLNLGIDFVNVYGATETGFPITAANCNDKYPTEGAGNVNQFPEISVIIDNPDNNGIGEIRVKTPLIMGGYYKDNELTATAFDDNGYFKTGDCGYIDKKGNLFVTGRLKESIVLHNGKKVSPSDIDAFYQNVCPDIMLASCGVQNEEGYDEIYLFIEQRGLSEAAIKQILQKITDKSSQTNSVYKLKQVYPIDKIPVTAIGKVKRYLLGSLVQNDKISRSTNIIVSSTDNEKSTEETVIDIIRSFRFNEEIHINTSTNLFEDLQLDSLSIFEICVALDEKFGVQIESVLNNKTTIGDIVRSIEHTVADVQPTYNDSDNYPLPKTEKDYKSFNRLIKLMNFLWNIEVYGKNNLNSNEKYIFCPNHESYLDGLWIIGSLDNEIRQSICCLAADRLFERRIYRRTLIKLGGIPVHRTGNTAPAMKRAYECLLSGDYNLLVHPEGTRTRNGNLSQFKSGAAKLSIETGIKIVPVCINGAYEIFPPHRKLPKLFDWKNFRKCTLQIQFGKPISHSGRTAEEITEDIRCRILEMKQKLNENI